MKRRLLIQLLLLLTFVFSSQAQSGAPAVTEARVQQLAREIFDNTMSPYCPGRTLSACPSEDARVLRDQIVAELSAGASREKVEAQLAGRFGEMVKGSPDAAGFGGLAILVPGVFVLLGGVMIFFFVRKQSKDGNAGDGNGA